MSDIRLIVGLGNPGTKYQDTRHNIGFCALRRLARRYDIRLRRNLFINAYVGRGIIHRRSVHLVLPLTYMNNSGSAVRRFIEKNAVALSNTIVVHDDLDLPFGQLRLKAEGGSAGHRGMTSIIEKLGTQHIARIKLGIGRPHHKDEVSDFVLSEFDQDECDALDSFLDHVHDCCICWLKKGTSEAMNVFNKRKKQ